MGTGEIELDRGQREFCTFPKGTVRLLAPAGCGKTYSLLYRCKALAEAEKRTRRFLVFTFTRAARDELRDRLKKTPIFANVAPFVTVNTLNAWGFRLLKNRIPNPRLVTKGNERDFCINNVLRPVWTKYERLKALLEGSGRMNVVANEVWNLIQFLKSMGLRHDRITTKKALAKALHSLEQCRLGNQVRLFYRRLIDLGIVTTETRSVPDTFEEMFTTKTPSIREVYEHFVAFWSEATRALEQAAFFSLEDQKYWARIYLEDDLAAGRKPTGQARFDHILVDEFQDINPLDLALLTAISRSHGAPLTIVGDDDQAIYEWRGASPEFILNPEVHLGGRYETFVLTRNYRSPRNIVEMSKRLIRHNRRRVPKDVVPVRRHDAEIRVLRHEFISDAVDHTVSLVKRLLARADKPTIALIGRKRSQIVPYQIVFAGEDIPFYAAEDLHVLLSEAFQELRSILAIRGRQSLGGMLDVDPISDLLKLCDKVKRFPISKKDREALRSYLYKQRVANLREAANALERYQGPLKGSNEGGRMSAAFAQAIWGLLNAETVAQAIGAISNHFDGLQKDYGKSLDDIFYTDPPFLYLGAFAERYGTDYARFYQDLERAIQTLARVPPDEEADERETHSDGMPEERLHLMTALRAKGKEFDAVIILDANDGIWPSGLASEEEDFEQERRLFYVAVTRARKFLYFVLSDNFLGEVHSPSRYLAEMGLEIPGGGDHPAGAGRLRRSFVRAKAKNDLKR
ncbi:Putative ATP-dependent DNA helicase YjcD [bacterium HR30]|nr:Putative ATP-dependent DNA helicase YjcD [bacterium HR30]